MPLDRETELIVTKVADEAAKRAVAQTMLTMGIDANDPITVQRNMAFIEAQRKLFEDEEYAADQAHLRKWRKAVEGVQTKGLLTLVSLIVVGMVGAFWVGFTSYFGK